MSCCGSELVNKLRRLQTRLAQKGNYLEAERTGRLADRAERATVRAATIVSRMDASKERRAEKPADVERYYKDCMKKPPSTAKGREKEYCSRVAWEIYCHKNPSHSGCTEYGRTKKSLPT